MESVCRGNSTVGSNPTLTAMRYLGEVPERSNGTVSKTVDRVILGPWVRIPPSPPTCFAQGVGLALAEKSGRY